MKWPEVERSCKLRNFVVYTLRKIVLGNGMAVNVARMGRNRIIDRVLVGKPESRLLNRDSAPRS
jgi:hypothetical protein